MKNSTRRNNLRIDDTDSIKFSIEDNFDDLFIFIAKINKLKLYLGKKISWVNSSPFCWPNFIFKTNLNRRNINKDLEKIIIDIKKKIIPPFWLLGPRSSIPDIGEIFEQYGIRLIDRWSGMAVILEKIDFSILYNDSFRINTVKDKGELKDWFNVVNQELFPNKKLNFKIFLNVLSQPNIKFFIGYFLNEPVATALSFNSSGVVGIYMVATSLNQRNKGFGSSITLAALLQAKKEGYSIGILHSTKLGLGIYKKIGFVEYCPFDVYWMMGNKYS